MTRKRVAVIGGGIVGLAAALRTLERFPECELTLLEKETDVGLHQSTHNSGVLHSGLYYTPGSLKAKLSVSGLLQMKDYCSRRNIAFEICGKLIAAVSAEEIHWLQDLFTRGQHNGLTGLEILEGERVTEIEPHLKCLSALRVPQEGIVDYGGVCDALKTDIGALGGEVLTGQRVVGLSEQSGSWVIKACDAEREFDVIINCAGLHSDRICRLAGRRPRTQIIPFRGEYYKIKPDRQYLVRNLIYPVPDPRYPFLGVHFTRLIHGGIECGPNAVLALAREGYRLTDFSLRDLAETICFRGFWAFSMKHTRMCMRELTLSMSKRLFCRALRRMVPDLTEDDILSEGMAGVRAQAMHVDGKLVQDFEIVEGDKDIHVINAPSPAATASLAIGERIAERVANRLSSIRIYNVGAI